MRLARINLTEQGITIPEDFGSEKYATIRKGRRHKRTPWGYTLSSCGQWFFPDHAKIDALKIAIELCKTNSWGEVAAWLSEVTQTEVSRELLRGIYERERKRQYTAKYARRRGAVLSTRWQRKLEKDDFPKTFYATKETGTSEEFVEDLPKNRGNKRSRLSSARSDRDVRRKLGGRRERSDIQAEQGSPDPISIGT